MSAKSEARVPRSVFDTRDFAPKKALSAWYENIGAIFDVRVLEPENPAFYSRIDAFGLGEMILAGSHSGTQSYDRSPTRIARDGLDHYMLQFYMTGSVTRRDEKGERGQTRPGDLWISDLAQPNVSVTKSADILNLVLPRRLLAPLLNAPDHHAMAILDGERPLVALLRSHVEALWRAAPAMTEEEAPSVVGPTLALAASALNGAVREEAASSIDIALRDEICRHARATPFYAAGMREAVAKQFGISLRKLDYLFEPLGGFAHWIRGERLAQARLILTSPAQLHMSIDDIATAYGFAHTTSFVRAFRNQYGMTPGQLRNLARERLMGGHRPDHTAPAGWQDWIGRL